MLGAQDKPAPAVEVKTLFTGTPSWKAFLREYAAAALVGALVPFLFNWIAGLLEAGTTARVLLIGIPIGLAIAAGFGINLYRRSLRYRITSSNLELEYGVLRKKIDNLELWRCRDIRFNQSLLDRVLGIAHIQIFTADVTTDVVLLRGMPASRRLFEQIRDSIEIQRQARNVVAMVQ